MSADREARILIVDDQREVARVMRTALELSNRGFHVIDVPSGEEALLEMGQPFDLVISDYRLPGMSGIELLERIHKVQSSIKMILMTAQALDEVTPKAMDLDLVDILEKPIDTEIFVETVTRAVSGQDRPVRLVPVTAADEHPLPEFDTHVVAGKLNQLLVDLGALGIAFIGRTGKILIKQGSVDEVPRFGELAVLLANNFTTTAEISTYLGDDRSTAVHYYDGNWYDIFALSVGVNFFVAVIYPGGSQRNMGAVLRFGKPGVHDIIDLINEDNGQSFPAAEPALEAEPAQVVNPVDWYDEAFPTDEAVAESPPPATDEHLQEALMSLVGEDDEVESIEMDIEGLEIDFDTAELDNLDGFWEEAAAAEETRISAEALSLDEAVELGLIPKDANIEEE